MNNVESKLMDEYVKKYKYAYWMLKIAGFNRYDVENGRMVQLGVTSILYKATVLTISNCAVCYLLYYSIFTDNYLKLPDGMCIIHFALYANLILYNITIIHRPSGVMLFESCIKIDLFLGYKEASILREIAHRTLIVLYIVLSIMNIIVAVFLFNAYKVSVTIHFVGSSYFFWLFFIYYDYTIFICLSLFLTLRVNYLNISLIKSGNMKEKYLPNNSLFNQLFWNRKINKFVKFQETRSIDDYITAYKMFYNMLDLIRKYYTFPVAFGVFTIINGSFVAMQTFIMRIKDTVAVEIERTIIIMGWALMSWGFLTITVTLRDMFMEQLYQTKYVCAFIQLKPNQPEHIYKLTKTVSQLISENDARFSLYNMVYFDKKLLFNMAASTLIYITVQLQMAFSKISGEPMHQDEFGNTTAQISKSITYRLL